VSPCRAYRYVRASRSHSGTIPRRCRPSRARRRRSGRIDADGGGPPNVGSIGDVAAHFVAVGVAGAVAVVAPWILSALRAARRPLPLPLSRQSYTAPLRTTGARTTRTIVATARLATYRRRRSPPDAACSQPASGKQIHQLRFNPRTLDRSAAEVGGSAPRPWPDGDVAIVCFPHFLANKKGAPASTDHLGSRTQRNARDADIEKALCRASS
jgi:hypothetical protein